MSHPIYHSHTHYCDGSDAPEVYVKRAIELGLPAYGFASHGPVPFKTIWNIPDERFPDYIREINTLKEKYKSEIEIYLGLEADYIPGLVGRKHHLIATAELDYIVGSIHFLGQLNDETQWNFDTSYEYFLTGFKEIFNQDFKKMATLFYEYTVQMIEEDAPEIIGHFDKIKMYNDKGNFFNENDKWYKDLITMVLDCMKRNDSIVEINTRGMYKYGQTCLYPSDWILKEMLKRDIRIQINPDAHHPDEISGGVKYHMQVLQEMGFKKQWLLLNNKWGEYDINEYCVED